MTAQERCGGTGRVLPVDARGDLSFFSHLHSDENERGGVSRGRKTWPKLGAGAVCFVWAPRPRLSHHGGRPAHHPAIHVCAHPLHLEIWGASGACCWAGVRGDKKRPPRRRRPGDASRKQKKGAASRGGGACRSRSPPAGCEAAYAGARVGWAPLSAFLPPAPPLTRAPSPPPPNLFAPPPFFFSGPPLRLLHPVGGDRAHGRRAGQ